MEFLKETVDYGVLGILFLMSFISIALSFERYFLQKDQSSRLQNKKRDRDSAYE